MNAALMNIILFSTPKFVLDQLKRNNATSAASYSLRKLRSGVTNAIRVRDDTTGETDIPFCGQNLCTSTLTGWLGRNLVSGIPLGVDGNANGVSDGWTGSVESPLTATFSIDESAQKIEITGGSDANKRAYVLKSQLCVPGNTVTITALAKCSNTNVRVRCFYLWFNGASLISGSAGTLSSPLNYSQISLSATAPANTTRVEARLDIGQVTVGDTGSAYFKDASVTISNQSAYISKWYDQSGNGNDAVQATAANQPRIVNAGVVERDFDATKANVLYPTFASASGVNIVSNGNFVNTDGWTSTGSTLSTSSNTLSITGNGSSSLPRVLQSTNTACVVGRRYFVKAIMRVTNASASNIRIEVDGTTAGTATVVVQQTSPVQNQWYTLSAIVTIPADFTGNIQIIPIHAYADAATANGKVMEVQEVVCVDVTEMGVPTCYFDGSNDVLSIANSASVDIFGAPLMLNGVLNPSAQDGYVFCKNADSAVTVQYGMQYVTATEKLSEYLEGSARQTTANNSFPALSQKIYTATFEAGSQQAYLNGTASGTAGNYNGALTSRANMQIGARSNNAGGTAWSVFFKGYISEITLFNAVPNRTKLETNQKKYYGVI